MTDEAATVHWLPAGVHYRDRTFDSIDEAVTFVMQELRETERTNAYIATAARDISIHDIYRMCAARKA